MTETIDTKAILAQLKELTGKQWRDWSHGNHSEFVQYTDTALMRRVGPCPDGYWSWRHTTKIGRHYDDYDLSAEVSGTSATMHEAAEIVMNFTPAAPMSLHGAIWHQHGEGGRIAVIDGEEAMVRPYADRFLWSRDWRGLAELRDLFPGACGSGGTFSGFSNTFEEAAEAAAHAPAKLKDAIAAWLKGPSPRELPTGAAKHFRNVALDSPEVDAHLAGALGDDRIIPLALADYLEAVAAQLRAEDAASMVEF